MKSFCVAGSLNMDLVTRVDEFPKPSETVEGISFGIFPGGKGANQAVALGRLGGKVRMVGRVGDDLFGRQYLDILKTAGVDTSGVEKSGNEVTGTASIEVDRTGENHIIIVAGANGGVSKEFVDTRASFLRDSDFLLLQLEIPIPSVIHAARIAKEAGRTVILDPAPARNLPPELFPLLDFITPNESEAQFMSGIAIDSPESARAAGERIIRMGAGTVVIKAGKHGAYLIAEGLFRHIAGFQVDAVDTTAAGDSFNAGLAHALAEGGTAGEAVRFANAVAALSTTGVGAQSAMPKRADVAEFLFKSGGLSQERPLSRS